MLTVDEKRELARKLGLKTIWDVNVLVDGFKKLSENEVKYIFSHLMNGRFEVEETKTQKQLP